MSSPTSQGKMGKTCLPQKVGEDGEDIGDDGDDIGEVGEAGEDIGDDGDDIGDDGDMSSPTSQVKTGKT